MEELRAFSDNLIERFENKLLGDTIERVGKDTKRKLSVNDRFVGTALLAEKLGVDATHILAGLAAGLHFAPETDETSIEVATYARDNGVPCALSKYCGISEDSAMAKKICEFYDKIKNGTPISQVVD